MPCLERIRLKAEVAQAEAWFDEVRRDFTISLGRVALEDLKVLHKRVDRAWARLRQARTAYDTHVADHSCTWTI